MNADRLNAIAKVREGLEERLGLTVEVEAVIEKVEMVILKVSSPSGVELFRFEVKWIDRLSGGQFYVVGSVEKRFGTAKLADFVQFSQED